MEPKLREFLYPLVSILMAGTYMIFLNAVNASFLLDASEIQIYTYIGLLSIFVYLMIIRMQEVSHG